MKDGLTLTFFFPFDYLGASRLLKILGNRSSPALYETRTAKCVKARFKKITNATSSAAVTLRLTPFENLSSRCRPKTDYGHLNFSDRFPGPNNIVQFRRGTASLRRRRYRRLLRWQRVHVLSQYQRARFVCFLFKPKCSSCKSVVSITFWKLALRLGTEQLIDR